MRVRTSWGDDHVHPALEGLEAGRAVGPERDDLAVEHDVTRARRGERGAQAR